MLPSPPSAACKAKTKPIRQPGTGSKETCSYTRIGVLDKLYNPTRLRRPDLRVEAGGGILQSIPQDARPLKVEAGRFVWV